MMFKQGTQRLTIETVRSGQPRPYADHIQETYVLWEHVPYGKPDGEFMPQTLDTYNGKPIGLDNIPPWLAWYEPHLTSFSLYSSRGPGWFIYIVKTAFTD